VSVIIRQATPDDAGAFAAIYAPYVQNTAVSFEYEPPTEAEFRSRITKTRARYPYFAAERNGAVVGYAYASAFRSREAYRPCAEMSVYVAESAHGCGVGRALYAAIEPILRRQHIYVAYARIAATDRDDPQLTDGSLRFHEKMGYRLVAVQKNCGIKFDRWWDIVLMEKELMPRIGAAEPFIPFSELEGLL